MASHALICTIARWGKLPGFVETGRSAVGISHPKAWALGTNIVLLPGFEAYLEFRYLKVQSRS
jgi:hypothetical protein